MDFKQILPESRTLLRLAYGVRNPLSDELAGFAGKFWLALWTEIINPFPRSCVIISKQEIKEEKISVLSFKAYCIENFAEFKNLSSLEIKTMADTHHLVKTVLIPQAAGLLMKTEMLERTKRCG